MDRHLFSVFVCKCFWVIEDEKGWLVDYYHHILWCLVKVAFLGAEKKRPYVAKRKMGSETVFGKLLEAHTGKVNDYQKSLIVIPFF